jgi:hypothetical protein
MVGLEAQRKLNPLNTITRPQLLKQTNFQTTSSHLETTNTNYKTIHITTKRQSKHITLSNIETPMFHKC